MLSPQFSTSWRFRLAVRLRSWPWACQGVIAACLSFATTTAPSAIGQPPAAAKPPSTLTAHQQDRLNERDRLGKKVQELKSRGNLTEAIVAADAALALEREVLGETSDDAIGSIELIAQMHEELGNSAAAKKARADVLNLRTGTLGNDHWKVTDARWACTRADTLAKLDGAATRRLLKAARLEEQVATLYAQGQYVEAVGPAPGAGYPSGVVGQARSRVRLRPGKSGGSTLRTRGAGQCSAPP